mgnify:CR=1 FL=1
MRKRNASSRFLAAEIEVSGVQRRNQRRAIEDAVKRWGGAIVRDGSIGPNGFEINTAPAAGDKYVQQIEEICRALSGVGASADIRCGLHVHADARDFDYFGIRRLVQIYAGIEDALFHLVPLQRRSNHYCQPCGPVFRDAIVAGKLPHKEVKHSVMKAVYQKEYGGASKPHILREGKYVNSRYYALNLHSWLFRGTIECRLFPGTVKEEKIIAWGMMWARILDWVQAHSDEEVADVLQRFSPKDCLFSVVSGSKLVDAFLILQFADPESI